MIYYALGSALVEGEELLDTSVYEKVTDFTSALAVGKQTKSIDFSTGKLSAKNFARSFNLATDNQPVEFQKIGLGLPLTIMIREVYTGRYPKSFWGGSKGMLVTSAIKSITSYDAKPKAVNFLMDKIKSKTKLERPSASSQGTPIVFYSPALLERSLTLDLTVIFDTFPQETFDQIGNFFTSAAGLPIFLAQSAYLVGAGMLLKLLGGAGEAIFDGNPNFASSDAIDIFLPGKPPMPPGFALITIVDIDQVDPTFRKKYQVNSNGQVVDSAGNVYQGDVPYIVISLDGTKSDELSSFTPTAASAAILSRFFGVKNKQEQSLDVLMNALKLYNDFSFRRQIDQLDKQIADAIGDEKTALETKRAALLKNISEELLKPKI